MILRLDDNGEQDKIGILSLTDGSLETPDYLKKYLASNGMIVQEVLVPPLSDSTGSLRSEGKAHNKRGSVQVWPASKGARIDALLRNYGVGVSFLKQDDVVVPAGKRSAGQDETGPAL